MGLVLDPKSGHFGPEASKPLKTTKTTKCTFRKHLFFDLFLDRFWIDFGSDSGVGLDPTHSIYSMELQKGPQKGVRF